MTIQRIIASVLLMILLASCLSATAISSTETILPTQNLATAATVPTAIPTFTATSTAMLDPHDRFYERIGLLSNWMGRRSTSRDRLDSGKHSSAHGSQLDSVACWLLSGRRAKYKSNL